MCTSNGKCPLARRIVCGRKKSGDPWNGACALNAQDSPVAGSQDFGFVVTEHSSLPQQERGGRRTDLLDGPDYFRPDRLVLIGDKVDQVSEQVYFGEATALHQGQSTGGAQGAGRVGAASPDWLHLDVAHAAEEHVSVLEFEG